MRDADKEGNPDIRIGNFGNYGGELIQFLAEHFDHNGLEIHDEYRRTEAIDFKDTGQK